MRVPSSRLLLTHSRRPHCWSERPHCPLGKNPDSMDLNFRSNRTPKRAICLDTAVGRRGYGPCHRGSELVRGPPAALEETGASSPGGSCTERGAAGRSPQTLPPRPGWEQGQRRESNFLKRWETTPHDRVPEIQAVPAPVFSRTQADESPL